MSEKVRGLDSRAEVELLRVMEAGVTQDLDILHRRLERVVDQLVQVCLCLRNGGHQLLAMPGRAGGNIQVQPRELEQLAGEHSRPGIWRL